MYTLISGSPKMKKSNSLSFLNIVSNNLDKYCIYELKKDKYEDILKNIELSSTILIAFPLYVDSPPALLLKFFDYIIDNNVDFSNKKVYIIINCGFREGEQNIPALNIVKNWCFKVNAKYMGSVLIGAGEVVEKYKIISKSVFKALKKLSAALKSCSQINDNVVTISFVWNRLYCYIANTSWNIKSKKNNLSKEDVKKC